MEEEVGDSFHCNGFLDRAENHPLSKAMVDHDQKGIETLGKGEICDKITRDLLEWLSGSGANWGEGWNGGMCVGFVLLANCTSLNILAYERCKARPPELGGDKLAGFKVTWVASSLMIVATNKDGLLKGRVRGNVNPSFVGEDALSILPVR